MGHLSAQKKKRIVSMDIRSFLFFSQRIWRTQTPGLFTFPIFFKWRQIMNLNTLRSCNRFRILLHGLHSPNYILRYLDRGQRIILIWVPLLYIDLRPRQTCNSKDDGSAYSIGVGELGWQYGTGLKSQTDAPEKGDLWTAWQLFPLDDDQTYHSKDGGSDTFRWPWGDIEWAIELLYNSVKTRSRQFEDRSAWSKMWLRKPAPSRKLGPRASGWAALENGK